MSDLELMRVRMLMAQSIAESRDRQIKYMQACFDIAIEIANFWRDQAPAGTEYPAELAAKIDALGRAA